MLCKVLGCCQLHEEPQWLRMCEFMQFVVLICKLFLTCVFEASFVQLFETRVNVCLCVKSGFKHYFLYCKVAWCADIYIDPNFKDKTKQYMNKLYMCSKNICKLMVWYSHLLAYIDLTKTLFKIYLPTIKLQNNYIVHKLQFSEFCYCLYVKK